MQNAYFLLLLLERQQRLLPGHRRRPSHPKGWSSHWPHRTGSQPVGEGTRPPNERPANTQARTQRGAKVSPPLGAANAAAALWTNGRGRLTKSNDKIKQFEANQANRNSSKRIKGKQPRQSEKMQATQCPK